LLLLFAVILRKHTEREDYQNAGTKNENCGSNKVNMHIDSNLQLQILNMLSMITYYSSFCSVLSSCCALSMARFTFCFSRRDRVLFLNIVYLSLLMVS